MALSAFTGFFYFEKGFQVDQTKLTMNKNSLCSWGCLWIADPLPPPKHWDCKCVQPSSHCHNLSTEFCASCSGLTEWWVLYSSLPPPVTTTHLSVSVQLTSPGIHPSYKVQLYGSFHFANSWCHLVGSFVVRYVWTFPSLYGWVIAEIGIHSVCLSVCLLTET